MGAWPYVLCESTIRCQRAPHAVEGLQRPSQLPLVPVLNEEIIPKLACGVDIKYNLNGFLTLAQLF